MALDGQRTYVGFGFGAVQAGLFLHEAYRSGAFRRLAVAEAVPGVVAGLRRAGGRFSVNIAHLDRVETSVIEPIEIEDPAVEADRERLIEAIALAHEIGTAVPSVQSYVSAGPGSLHRILAAGLRRKAASAGPLAVVYAAENHNRAAAILESKVLEEVPEAEREAVRARVRFLDTVIGKMSGVISDPNEVAAQGLAPVTPQDRRAFLVEAFNDILISRIRFGGGAAGNGFHRGLGIFREKDDLAPFEEAKLYGHNATHALAAYVGAARGVQRLADLRGVPGALPFLRAAFLEESGEALVSRHRGADGLFTHDGYRQFADDLLGRMTNPYLRDTVERVGRDPARKLAWDDRLVGTMRLALAAGVEPRRYALGAAAAALSLDRHFLEKEIPAAQMLVPLWKSSDPAEREAERVLDLVEDGRRRLRRWRLSGFQDLELLFHRD